MANKRIRLMSFVQGSPATIATQDAPEPIPVNSGNPEWFLENISCQYACPAVTDVARYIAHIASQDFEASYQINLEDNVFPALLGRVCARPCEQACRRGRVDRPIAICWLKRASDDYRKKYGQARPTVRPAITKREQVAVVGSGPAGLACARDLAKMGYLVVVYEALPVAGGMFTCGIPAWRLPRDVCFEEIDQYMADLGVEIRVNSKIGPDGVPLNRLMNEYDAVYLAAGTQRPQKMRIPGEELPGVVPGLTFMEEVNLGLRTTVPPRVAVIGGGFTAMDCSRSSLRMGADKVWVLYRRSRNEMLVYEEEAHEAEIEGVDFRFLVAPLEVVAGNGTAVGLKCVRNRLGEPDASGRRRPVPIPGSEFILELDMVIAATGQSSDTSWFPADMGVEVVEGRPVVDRRTWMTNVPGLFAGGDYVSGARNLISAIGEGHKAAFAIDQFLRGVQEEVEVRARHSLVPYQDLISEYHLEVQEEIEEWASASVRRYTPGESYIRLTSQPISVWTDETMRRRLVEMDDYDLIARQQMPMLPADSRWQAGQEERNLRTEVETGFTESEAYQEAKRCLQCQLNIFIDGKACILCNGCVDVCPTNVISMVAPESIGSVDGDAEHPALLSARAWPHGAAMLIDEDLCIRCGLCVQRCPTNCITMQHFEPKVTRIERAALPEGSTQKAVGTRQ